MKVFNKSLKVLLLSTTLMTAAKAAGPADLTFTADAYTTLADKIAVNTTDPTKAAAITAVSSALDKAYIGPITSSLESYVLAENATPPSFIKFLAIVDGKWCTFEASGTTSPAFADSTAANNITDTKTLVLTQTTEDGASPAGTPKTFTVTFTPTTASSASITRVQQFNLLKSIFTAANKSAFSTSDYTITIPTTPTPAITGWTAKGKFSAGTSIVLDPIGFTLTAPVTLAAGGAAVNYTVAVTDISAYNVAANSAYSANVSLANGSNSLTLSFKPGNIANRTFGILTGLVNDTTLLTGRRLKATSPFTYPTLSGAVDTLNAQLATTPTAATTDTLRETVDVILTKIGGGATNVETGIQTLLTNTGASSLKDLENILADGYIKSVNFAKSEGSLTVGTSPNEYTFVSMTALSLNKNSWANNGSKVVVTSSSGATLKTYSCELSGLSTMIFKNDNNPVLKFSTDTGGCFWIKSFDTTGIDKSSDTPASFKDDHLAMAIAEEFYGASGTIDLPAKTLAELKTASES